MYSTVAGHTPSEQEHHFRCEEKQISCQQCCIKAETASEAAFIMLLVGMCQQLLKTADLKTTQTTAMQSFEVSVLPLCQIITESSCGAVKREQWVQ